LAFVAASFVSGSALAQTGQNFGELVGKVVDDQGAVLPGVTVTLKGPALMGASTAVTNDRGLYRFPAVPSGTYTLTFDCPVFRGSSALTSSCPSARPSRSTPR
jgi:hypothetical protein